MFSCSDLALAYPQPPYPHPPSRPSPHPTLPTPLHPTLPPRPPGLVRKLSTDLRSAAALSLSGLPSPGPAAVGPSPGPSAGGFPSPGPSPGAGAFFASRAGSKSVRPGSSTGHRSTGAHPPSLQSKISISNNQGGGGGAKTKGRPGSAPPTTHSRDNNHHNHNHQNHDHHDHHEKHHHQPPVAAAHEPTLPFGYWPPSNGTSTTYQPTNQFVLTFIRSNIHSFSH